VTAEYEIVRYAPEFRAGIARLQTHLWSPDVAVNDAYFAWKHLENPLQTAPLVWLVLFRREVVVMRSFLVTRWEAGRPPERFEALYSDDFAIAPAHRNRGLVSRIMKAAFSDLAREGRELAINLSAGQVTTLSSLVDGWKNVRRVDPIGRRSGRAAAYFQMYRLLRRLPVLSGAPARTAARAGGRAFWRFDRAIARQAGPAGRGRAGRAEPRAEAMASSSPGCRTTAASGARRATSRGVAATRCATIVPLSRREGPRGTSSCSSRARAGRAG
jgi:hypothetical protein